MEDRPLIDGSEGASFDAQTLELLRRAFDQAWIEVEGVFLTRSAKKAGRVVLAEGILASARDGTRDLSELRLRGHRFLIEIFPNEMAR
jgi:hypothetical protein